MRKTLQSMLLPAAMMMVSGTAAADSDSGLRCEARLSGEQETADVQTEGSGRFVARFDKAFKQVDVFLKVGDVPDVTRAHLHCARSGANGPIAFGLFDPGPLEFDGSVSRGTLFNEDFNDADCGPTAERPVNNIAALAFAMRDGLVYINVHSATNPGGEVRGQIICGDGRRH